MIFCIQQNMYLENTQLITVVFHRLLLSRWVAAENRMSASVFSQCERGIICRRRFCVGDKYRRHLSAVWTVDECPSQCHGAQTTSLRATRQLRVATSESEAAPPHDDQGKGATVFRWSGQVSDIKFLPDVVHQKLLRWEDFYGIIQKIKRGRSKIMW